MNEQPTSPPAASNEELLNEAQNEQPTLAAAASDEELLQDAQRRIDDTERQIHHLLRNGYVDRAQAYDLLKRLLPPSEG